MLSPDDNVTTRVVARRILLRRAPTHRRRRRKYIFNTQFAKWIIIPLMRLSVVKSLTSPMMPTARPNHAIDSP